MASTGRECLAFPLVSLSLSLSRPLPALGLGSSPPSLSIGSHPVQGRMGVAGSAHCCPSAFLTSASLRRRNAEPEGN